MMQRYIFVGNYTEIGDRVFSRLGQSADWDEAFYQQIIGGAAFIPNTEFKKIGFTQDELDRYADYGNRALAPASFNAKVKEATLVLCELREKLSTRAVPEEIASQELPAASC